jgi:hypothetical protein
MALRSGMKPMDRSHRRADLTLSKEIISQSQKDTSKEREVAPINQDSSVNAGL